MTTTPQTAHLDGTYYCLTIYCKFLCLYETRQQRTKKQSMMSKKKCTNLYNLWDQQRNNFLIIIIFFCIQMQQRVTSADKHKRV